MKISPSIVKIYKDYFDSFKEKKKIIKSAKKVGRVWVVGEILTTEEINFGSNATITETTSRIDELLESRVKVVELHICSNGGDASAGFAICDYLRKTNLPIITIAYGEVCSMAVCLFEIGVIRRMTALSTLMMHHAQGGVDGTPEKMKQEAERVKYVNEISFILSSMRSGIPVNKLKKMSRPLKYFTPDDAFRRKLADEII